VLWGVVTAIGTLLPLHCASAQALPSLQETANQPTQERFTPLTSLASGETMEQITSVSELRDVAPSEWAYEALRNLVERYGCIVGYPNRTFRGDRALSRWEFAAGLNACLNTIERLLQENVAVLREDLDKLKGLAEEFRVELAALGARVDNLDKRVAFLEDHQFSTTTKLEGEAVVALYGVAGGEKFGGQGIPQVPALGYRTRLELNTSFTGSDLLFTRLSASNIPTLNGQAGTFQGNLQFAQVESSTDVFEGAFEMDEAAANRLALEVLYYHFPVTKNLNTWIAAFGGAADDFTNTYNFLDGDGGSGALSAFGTRNPIYFTVEGSGVGFQGQWGDFHWSAGYLASEGDEPTPGLGLFNGPYGAIAQIGYQPNDNLGLALTYVHTYNQLDTGTGSNLSNFQAFTDKLFGEAVPTVNNSYGIEFSWKIAPQFVLGGWGGYTRANTLDTLDGQINRGSLDIWNWAITLAFPDLLKEGSVGGIIVGMQPWVASSNIQLPAGIRNTDNDTSLHIEAFYQYALTDHISITPGIIVETSPNYDSRNGSLIIGTIRTTFTF
jgi:hypothetical protein